MTERSVGSFPATDTNFAIVFSFRVFSDEKKKITEDRLDSSDISRAALLVASED